MDSESPPFTYVPAGRFTGGHTMTLWTWARRRRFPRLPAPEARLFDTAPNVRVLAHCHWQPDRRSHPALLALHGLEGSSEAHYILGISEKAFAAGFNVVRLNQRNCGGTEHLCASLYHSGLTADPVAVMRELIAHDGIEPRRRRRLLAGRQPRAQAGGRLRRRGPPELRAVCAVSPVLDLEACVRALERPGNALYQWNFVRNLKARMRRKAQLFPERFPLEPLPRIRTVRQFDEVYTAPHFGFAGATDYYYRASALRVGGSHPCPGARPDGGRRSVRPAGTVLGSGDRRQSEHHRAHLGARRTLCVRRSPGRRRRRVLGGTNDSALRAGSLLTD